MKISLRKLLQGLALSNESFNKDRVDLSFKDVEISGITCDSRKVKKGDLFVAISGESSDGKEYALDAQKKGAVAVLSNKKINELSILSLACNVELRELYTLILSRFYSDPISKLKAIAVTGTNGKTSTAWIVSRLLTYLEQKNILAGTLGVGVLTREINLDNLSQTNNTTPIAEDLFKCIEDSGAKLSSLCMEVTSQGLAQSRTVGFNWDVAIFTNLTRDHLDLHGSFENYAELKSRLFKQELLSSKKENKLAVINVDDSYGASLHQSLKKIEPSKVKSLALSFISENADVFCLDQKVSIDGIEFSLSIDGEKHDFKSKLIGTFNLWNLTSAVTSLYYLGYDLEKVKSILPLVENVPGRLEHFDKDGVHIFVDYAHTPDALDSVQKSLLELNPKNLITVFGCGGNRDKGKRALMAKSVQSYSTKAVVTSDNPRDEKPSDIIGMIVDGFTDSYDYQIVENRAEAIKKAIEISGTGDIVLIAGKGHETYQEICGVKHAFDDREVVRDILV